MEIYVKFAEEKKPKTIKEFLLKVFSEKDDYGYVTNIITYSNKDCTIIQCVKQKYRSFDDILELVKTYYISATAKKVFKELLHLRPINKRNNKCRLHMMSCSAIQGINLLYTQESNVSDNQNNYSYICNHRIYNSKYSWSQLFKKLNINSNEDFTNYLKQIDEK